MALPEEIGYEGFENPEDLYPGGTDDTLPTVYTASYQVRQFGVGGASTTGYPVNILSALESPPTAMVTAAGHAISETVVTSSDIMNYYPATHSNPNA